MSETLQAQWTCDKVCNVLSDFNLDVQIFIVLVLLECWVTSLADPPAPKTRASTSVYHIQNSMHDVFPLQSINMKSWTMYSEDQRVNLSRM